MIAEGNGHYEVGVPFGEPFDSLPANQPDELSSEHRQFANETASLHRVSGKLEGVRFAQAGSKERTNPNGGTPFMAAENSAKYHYTWQSEQARMVASTLERSEGAALDIDEIDVCAITPLDALNLLSLMQKKRKAK